MLRQRLCCSRALFLNCTQASRCHHRLKTFHDGWHDVQLPDGTILWTSPTGQVYRTKPGGVDLFPKLGPPPCTAPTPYRRDRSRERSARIARARKRNRHLRPLNAEARRNNYARRYEIDAPKNRNRMRRTLMLFKGRERSTSPFSTWINEPFEPEELRSDWRPPPPPPPGPDEPPF